MGYRDRSLDIFFRKAIEYTRFFIREGTALFIGGRGGGGPGLRRGGSSVKFLENGEGQTFWSRSPVEGHRFFITTKNLLHVTSLKSTLYFIIKIQTLWKTETAFAYN